MAEETTGKVAQEADKVDLRKDNDSVIFVGNKPLVNYIRGVIIQFNKWNAPEVTIKSRGKFISKAVDVAEVSRRTLQAKGVKIKGISISSESFESEGKRTNISTMDIVLSA
ncbi:MAG: DNA-binding protein [Nanoarchaeota archaeon]